MPEQESPHQTEVIEQHSQNVVAAERFKSPFFIQEATLKQTLQRLKEIDPTKKKIIIYVGFHPNEGTDKIGRAVQQECRDRYRMPSSA
jgi:hypothetical protein